MRIPVRHQIQDGETIFSWIARLYRTGPFFNERQARELLLGSSKVRLHPYLTSHLNVISAQTQEPSALLLRRHTLYPLFWWFGLDPESRLQAAMFANRGDRAIILAGLPHAKLHFFEGLKYCPVCVNEDRSALGFGYFKIQHQISGIEACSKHGCELLGLESGDYGYDRHLPLPPSNSIIVDASPIQVQFARFTEKVLRLSCLATQPLDYLSLYAQALSERELITACQHIRLQRVLEGMSKCFSTYTFGSRLGIPTALQYFAFVGPMLRTKTHYPCHPVKHLLFSFWLFNGDADLISARLAERQRGGGSHIPKGVGSLITVSQKVFDEHMQNTPDVNQKKKTQKAIETLSQARYEHPEWRRKELKAAYAAEFFLLYHHHRALLESILPPKMSPIHQEKDWTQEDNRLAAAIKLLDPVAPLSLSEIEHRINGRGFLRKKLAKLPECRALLKRLGKLPNQ